MPQKLTKEQMKANAEYFAMIIRNSQSYTWKDKGELFKVENGKLKGTKRGVEACKEITLAEDHHMFEEK